ncbi:MAG: hypothetical protein ABGZ53_27995 [Fuerstiella sp.]
MTVGYELKNKDDIKDVIGHYVKTFEPPEIERALAMLEALPDRSDDPRFAAEAPSLSPVVEAKEKSSFSLPANAVELTHDEMDVNDEVLRRLSKLNILYTYQSSLVQIEDGRVMRYGLATIRELIANNVFFVCELTEEIQAVLESGKASIEDFRKRPPKWCYEPNGTETVVSLLIP